MIWLSIFTVLVVGCNFDEKWQLDLRYPATLEIKNDSQEKLKLKSISNSLETEAGFVFKGESIRPGGTLSMRIPEDAYDAIRAGAFVAYGTCGDIKNWEKKGTSLAVQAVENTSQWKVTVSITECSE